MRKLCVWILAVAIAWGVILPANGQDSSNMTGEDILNYRPLGRFEIDGEYLIHSSDGYHIAGIRVVEQLPEAEATGDEVLDEEASDVVEDGDEAAEETTEETEDVEEEVEPVYINWLTMWDIRRGEVIWSVELPQRDLQEMAFSPTGETLYVKTTLPYPHAEEIRLTFFETTSGKIISETGNIDVIDAPVIPGDLRQELSAESNYSADGQHVVVDYRRRVEAPRCAVWSVDEARLLWEEKTVCGVLNVDGRYMLQPQPHANPYSSYNQLTVYDVVSGDVIAESEDEITDYRWLDATRVMIHRPYGDPPVIWDVLNNTRVVLELPTRMGAFFPRSFGEFMLHVQEGVAYLWNKTNGRLLHELPSPGILVEIDGQILSLEIDPAWRELEPEEREATLAAFDFLTGQEVWHTRWQHDESSLTFSPDGQQALAFDTERYMLDVFDLRTGQVLGSLTHVGAHNYGLTPRWDYLLEVYGRLYTVWGPEEAAGAYNNPPTGRARQNANLQYEASTQYDPAGSLGEGQYVWVVARTANRDWLLIQAATGATYWTQAENIELFIPVDDIPLDK